MQNFVERWHRPAALLAINLLYAVVWGFAGISKWVDGRPSWFAEKFGSTILGHFPGMAVSFWSLVVVEVGAFVLTAIALLRAEFVRNEHRTFLTAALVVSLFIFVQLGFGLWLTKDFNGAFQQFVYFGVTLVALQYVQGPSAPKV